MLVNIAVGALLSQQALTLPKFEPAQREFRAAWVATVDNIDWPSRKDLSTEAQKKELERIVQVAEGAGLNAIIFQVRPSTDSLYKSSLEPWSEFLTNKQGKAPDPAYDPLEFLIEMCRPKGIEVHAWFNPYRAKHFKATGPLDPSHVFKKRPDITKQYGRYLWMDPGEPDTQSHSLAVFMDVLKRYDIDGIHIDDYFYPYEEKDASGNGIRFPDQASYQKYLNGGGKLSLSDWRRWNVDTFVKRIYSEKNKIKKFAKFGISPFGIARPNQPEGVKAGIDQYDHPLYADCRKWLVEGWCDYFTPQLYWKIDSPGQPYGKLQQWWIEQNTANRHLWIGNYTGRLASDQGDWALAEVENQIAMTRKSKGATGNVHFSFKAIQGNWKGLYDNLRSKTYRTPALVPSSPWLGSERPAPPKTRILRDGYAVTLRWPDSVSKKVRWWGLYTTDGKKWTLHKVIGGEADEYEIERDDSMIGFAVTAISPTGIESEPAVHAL